MKPSKDIYCTSCTLAGSINPHLLHLFLLKKLIVDEVRLFYLTKLAAIEPHDSKMTYIPIFLKEQLEMNKNQIMSIT